MIIGIDATNILAGGGVTHIVELLRSALPAENGISKIVVWGSAKVLDAIEDRLWLEKRSPAELELGLVARTFWQARKLSQAALMEGCNLLFVLGGTYRGNYRPVVTMSQNLLPFEMQELRRYGFSLKAVRLLILRFTQTRTFRDSNGVIFLSAYAKDSVLAVTGKIHGRTTTIPHGLNTRFLVEPRFQRAISDYSTEKPFRMLYVSIVDQYKHQWHVVEAVASLRREGLPIVLDLVGPAFPPALARLEVSIEKLDPNRRWINYHGEVPYEKLNMVYAESDLGIWASSCETFGIILLEAMAAGLPIACSNRGPAPEILGEGGVFYFDPEQPADIALALRTLVSSPTLREEKARASYQKAKTYSWKQCSNSTFRFLVEVALEFQDASKTTIPRGAQFHEEIASDWGPGYTRGSFKQRLKLFNSIFDRNVTADQLWLDLGCGSGVLASELLSRGARVVALDGSPKMLEAARRTLSTAAGGRVSFLKGDVQDLSWSQPHTFDGVLCSSVVEYADDPNELISNVSRVLKNSGVLIISMPPKTSIVRSSQKILRLLLKLFGINAYSYLEVSRFEIAPSAVVDWLAQANMRLQESSGFDSVIPKGLLGGWIHPSLLICVARKIDHVHERF